MFQRHPYIITSVIAALLAGVVWLFTPKIYSATTTISDEYKEMDLAIGLSVIKAQVRDITGNSNTGMNDMEIYCKILNAESFARDLSHMQIPGKQLTYGEYLEEKDTIESIQKRIEYNYSTRKTTLTIRFSDKDPLVATQMLDCVTKLLQEKVTRSRHAMIQHSINNARTNLDEATKMYKKAETAYASFYDANTHIKTQKASQEEQKLLKELQIAEKLYQDATKQYVRQLALKKQSVMSYSVVKNNSLPLKDNRNFLLYFISILIILLIGTKGYLLYKEQANKGWSRDWGDFFSPWTLTIFIWGADITLYFLQGNMYDIGPKFIVCFAEWIVILIPASLLSYWLTQKSPTPPKVDYRTPISVSKILFNVLCVVSGTLTFIYAWRIWGVVSQFDLNNLLFNLRIYVIEDNSVTGLLNHVQGLNFALFVVGLWMYPKISKWQLAYIIIVNLVFEIFRMEKSGILIMILGTMFMMYERKKIKIRSILFSFIGIIILFFFFNLSKEDVDSETESTFLDFFGMYVTSPMVAFDRLYPDLSGNFGENTFCILYPYINMLGFNFEYMDRLQEFAWVPIPTNVYTIMQPFYNDFGMLGIGFFALIYGVFFGWTYRRFRDGDPIFICIYTYLVEVIIIQFYNDNLLQNIVLFIEFCFCSFILTQRRFIIAFDKTA